MERHFTLLSGERGVLQIEGADRREFLQGLVTNDVAKLGSDRALYAALLTAQGRYLHDFFLAEHGETFLLDVEAARLADLARRLTTYKLRSRVSLKPVSEYWAVAVAFGAEPLSALELSSEPGAAAKIAGGVAFVDPRLVALGARLILPRATAAAVMEARGFLPAEPDAYDRLRLSLGVPDGSRDLLPERALLLESGFDELNGIDWNKGCYIGQELTARTKYRGLVKKRLLPVAVEGPLPQPGAIVFWGDEEAGEMRSSRGGNGLALLRLDALERASKETPLRAGEARLSVTIPAWAKL